MGRERGILFSAPMVRALLAGTKTQTRRAVKPQPSVGSAGQMMLLGGKLWEKHPGSDAATVARCPYDHEADEPMRLWVRETWCNRLNDQSRPFDPPQALYAADGREVFLDDGDGGIKYRKDGWAASPWKPGIHMPRWASRITLEITEVRVQRLQEISEEDARAEGVDPVGDAGPIGYRDQFMRVWNGIYGVDAWDANPYVWAISFKRVDRE